MGKSEITIPVIPFGTQGFGTKSGHVADDEPCELMRLVIDSGVNHFDTALFQDDTIRHHVGKGRHLRMPKEVKISWNRSKYRGHHELASLYLKTMESGELDVLLTFDGYNVFGTTAAVDILSATEGRDIDVLSAWAIKRDS